MATFQVLEGIGAGEPAASVQFNPASLEYSLSNEFDTSSNNNSPRQFVKKTSGKLTMSLVFDTTLDGSDVRIQSEKISKLMQPSPHAGKKFAPKVEFAWGTYRFRGVVEQYKETIDFFSASGIPLRASINLTLASQDVEFQSSKNPSTGMDANLTPEPVTAPTEASPTKVAQQSGDSRGARDVASSNGCASLRFSGGAGLTVGGGISLAAAADFSVGGGAGLSLGGGLGAGIGGGISLGAGASLGAGMSLGVSATAGAAFTGLRASPVNVSISAEDARAALLPAPRVATGDFTAGGRAQVQAGASLIADVGGDADLHTAIKFET